MSEPSYVIEPDHPPKIARFGTFEVDLQNRELRRAGKEVRIQVQPFRILALLIERAGQIVTREELQERLWPSEFVDFEHSLNAAIRKLREALGDSAENPKFIETLARRGYRFIAPVSWDSDHAARKDRRPIFAVSAILAAVLIAAIIYTAMRTRSASPTTPIDAVAILPFTNDDPQTQYLSDGLTEILIDRLSRLPDLRVMARTTVFSYKGKDARKSGQALNVSGVINGNIRRTGNRYAIHIELIDVKDGSQLWGHQFDAETANLSAVESRISDELTTQLSQGVTRQQRRLVAERYTRVPEAYDAYLWGVYGLNNRLERGNLESAITWFNEAIARDPSFAAAYAGLANTYGVMVGYGRISVDEGSAKVLSNARKALDLDPNNAEALVAIATTKYKNLWDFPGAEADYKRGLKINPNYATGHQWYADYLRSMGRWADARREVEIAYKLDPMSPQINSMMCFTLYFERRFNDAVAFSQRAARTDPRFGSPPCVSNALFALGDIDGAMAVLTDKHGENGPYPKDPKKLFLIAAEKLKQSQNAAETPVLVAMMYARAGRTDDAFAWLEKAYQRRVSMLTNMNIEPSLDSLRSDPRYDDLLRRIGLPRVEPPRVN